MAERATTRDLDEGKYLRESEDLAAQAAAAKAAGDDAGAAELGTQSVLLGLRVGGKRGYYVTGGYQIGAASVYATFAEQKYMIVPGVTQDQSSTALGVDYDLTPESVLKLEAKRVSVPSHSTGLFRAPAGTDADELDGAMIYATSYNLTF
jgi:hypothetical protein